MSSYSFQGRKRVWTPRDVEENRAIFSTQKNETGIKMPNEFKPVYLANAEYEVQKWSTCELVRLLRLYGAHRCLWDVRDPENRVKRLRKAALIDITAAMGGDVTRAQVVKKLNVLRATYRYEKRRIKQRIRKGTGARTKLKWFALADAFLRHVPRAEKFRKNEDADTDSDLEDAVVFTIDPETLIPLDEEEEDLVNGGHNAIKQEITTATYASEFLVTHISDASVENVVVKTEDPVFNCQSEHSPFAERPAKPMWTSKESLQFVRLLKEHPTLWNSNLQSTQDKQTKAIKKIAKTMKLPLPRIQRRVHILRRTFKSEQLKMLQNKNYRPNFVWWAEAESFMDTTKSNLELQHFVDANEPPPATPINMQSMRIKREVSTEQQDFADFENMVTPINPIPSVAPPSVTTAAVDEAMEELFNEDADKSLDIKIEPSVEARHVAPQQITAAPPTTKLIWNGLEDDLLEGKWSLKHSVKFLRLYGAHRCLWDLRDPDYRSRELRNAAIEDIAAAMGYGLDSDYVAKKIKIFRITYMQHRKRMLEAIKQGKEPEIQLRWFPLADSFLRPHIGLRSIKEQEREMPQFDFQDVFANLNLIDPALLTDFRGKGTQNTIEIGAKTVHDEDGPVKD